eukprot:s2984_g4.t2
MVPGVGRVARVGRAVAWATAFAWWKEKGKDNSWWPREEARQPSFPTFDAMPVQSMSAKGPGDKRQDKLKKAFIKERGKPSPGGTIKTNQKETLPTVEEEQAWDSLFQEAEEDDDMGLTGLLAGALAGHSAERQAAKQRMLQEIAARREKLQKEPEAMTPPPPTRRRYTDGLTPAATNRPVTGGIAESPGESPARGLPEGIPTSTRLLHPPCRSQRALPDPSLELRGRSQSSKPRVGGSGLAEQLEARREENKARDAAAETEILSDGTDEDIPIEELTGNGPGEPPGLVE